MKQDYVTHRGIITKVSGGSLVIRTEDACHCDGCAVSALCNKTESTAEGSQPASVTITVPDSSRFREGERVEAMASSGSTLSAAWWALIVPTLLFIGVILGVRLGWPESGAWSIGAGFVVLVVYDFILYLLRNRLAKRLVWTVQRI